MSKYSRFVVLSSALLFMLLFGLACPVAVSADDGGPTPPATEEPVQPPAATEEPAATEPAVIATEEPVVVEATPSPVAEPTEGSGAEPSTDEDDPVDELLQAAGEDTKIVVLDGNNKVLPLASKQAVAVVTAVGPIWCPAGVQPGGAGCTAQFASPQALIDDMAANPANYDEDGIIYFTVDAGGEFVLAPGSGALDGTDFDTIRGSNLTLQGGWSGKNGDISFAQTSFGDNSVQIGDNSNPWAGNITIKNITIDGAGTTGLVVITEGDIDLNKVNSGGNDGDGAYLDGCIFVDDGCTGNGTITVSSSAFSDNSVNGLEAYYDGNIMLTGVTAEGNAADGVYLDNRDGSGGSVGTTITSSTFAGNGMNGVEVLANNDIALASVTANSNAFDGAFLYNLFSGNISVVSSTLGNVNSGNGRAGLTIWTNGNATLEGVTANDNSLDGADVHAVSGGFVSISNSSFNGNLNEEGGGLYVSTAGMVTLDNVSASNNPNGSGVGILNLSGVVITNSTFDGNAYDGIDLLVFGGDATISCSSVQNNGSVGVDGSYVNGTFTLDDVNFAANGMDYSGTPVFTSHGCKVVVGGSKNPQSSHSLPLHIVPVGGGEKVDLDCRGYSGTKLILPDGDNVILYCPVLDDAYLTSLDLQGVSTVPGGFTFVSGMEVKVTRGGEPRTSVGHNVVASFVVPEDKIGSNFTILHWDGSAWNELGGSYADGYFSVETSSVGVFILAIK